MNKGIYRIAAGVGAAVILVSSATAQAATVTANGTPAPVASDSIAGWPAAPAVTSETAVLIDADNISPKYAPIIFQELEAYGFPSCRRIYGNWSKANGWNEELLLEYSIIPVQQFSYTSGKNATDMAMVIDAMDLLYGKKVDGFCIVTSDSDFTRLAMRLREEHMYVIGMGAAIITGEYDIAQIMLKAGLGILGLLIIVFSTVTTTFLDAYSAGISSETVVSRWNGKHVAIVVTVIGTAAAIVYPMDNITDFLYLIGSVFAPMIAIQIADFFLLKQDKSSRAVYVPNMIIWVIGFVVYRILMNVDMPVGNTLPDMVITIVLCLIAGKLIPEKNQKK